MREQLNNNPAAQLAVIAVLLLAGGFFLITKMGGGGEEAAEEAPPITSTAPTEEGVVPVEEGTAPATASAAVPQGVTTTPRLPQAVLDAWRADRTVVLLFVHDGGIDDKLVRKTTANLSGFPETMIFEIPASQIAQYTAVTEGVGLQRVPALVVLSPRHLNQQVPTASISYGFQTRASVEQAVIDAGYKGPTLEYHP